MAEWLCNDSGPASYLDMDESYRPVKLRKVVLGFPCSPNQNDFKFDLSLNYKMANIIQTYSDQKPALVVGGSVSILGLFGFRSNILHSSWITYTILFDLIHPRG